MFQVKVVFDDSVMCDIKPTAAITVWVGIRFAWPAMSCPACVADAALHGAVCRICRFDLFLKCADPAHRADYFGFAFVDNRDAARVVTSVLESLQAVHQHARDFPISDISDNSAHT